MPGVRPLSRDDIPRVADLHLKGFPGARSKEALEGFLADIMFEHPWLDDRMPSLGYEGPDGTLIGCLGVMPRPMTLNGRPLEAAISNNFIVDPDGRPGIVAFALMRALRSAGADLILGEANRTARDICERLGWVTVHERSRRWLRPLRPAALGAGLFGTRRLPPSAARLLESACRLPDTISAKAPGSPFRITPPASRGGSLDEGRLLELLERTGERFALHPRYDEPSVAWLLATLRRTRREQTLRGGIVPGCGGGDAGWYLYYSRPGGIGRVLQLGSDPGQEKRVLDHLLHDAWEQGNHALSGQTDPAWTGALQGASCFVREGSSWMIAHAPDETTRQALSSEDAFMSHLETEGWITFAF